MNIPIIINLTSELLKCKVLEISDVCHSLTSCIKQELNSKCFFISCIVHKCLMFVANIKSNRRKQYVICVTMWTNYRMKYLVPNQRLVIAIVFFIIYFKVLLLGSQDSTSLDTSRNSNVSFISNTFELIFKSAKCFSRQSKDFGPIHSDNQ